MPPTCHCEGALRPWQSREGTCSLYKLLLKRCAPIASVAALSERHAGQQHVAHGFCGVTPPELSLRGRFAPVAISQYLAGLWESCRRNRNCLHEIATSASGLLAMTNLWPSLFYRQPVRIGSNAPGPAQHKRFVPATVKMEKAIDLSLRGRFAPVAISQYLAGLWESCRRNRNCLHEIATSASGLLAMTNLWPSLFYRQPVRIGSNAPGPAQHKRFVPATVKMEKAIDLSLRGRFAPVAISGRHLQSVQATVKTVCTNCVCSGAQ